MAPIYSLLLHFRHDDSPHLRPSNVKKLRNALKNHLFLGWAEPVLLGMPPNGSCERQNHIM